ncbi:GNAT family N-acetyltransferase [Ktedonobacter racemifer]|uniref:GCN5-related N-acetyltransferase n=1 Tax=Ktedonobacter racemifer DSM 44963 TaxID=485913 RepID=D6TTQ9_KTERA|nr:GNAT family N-acetyltransferase [Ktedonobacter racemifer]EFH83810.1 GCN5-related N-acetyltransferase [Ktedonobacter racemifer DSM 44963]
MSQPTPDSTTNQIILRDVIADDLPIFYEQQLDPEAIYMAAFTAKDPADHEAFMRHWQKILADESTTNKTIISGEQVAGSVSSYRDEEMEGPEVTYWLGKSYWGQGIATQALTAFLDIVQVRPIFARVAKDNLASRRVLEKCGFTICGEGKGYANARGAETEEFILRLEV